MIYTAVVGKNADLIEQVAAMYIKDGARVADVTYGKGAFWRSVDTSRFEFLATDLVTTKPTMNFLRLRYDDDSMDHVIFDPPYMHNAGKPLVEENYKNAETTKGMYHDDIMRLYRQGMLEALRVLRVGGLLWVKCQDEVESSHQRWSHIEIYDAARRLGLYPRDLFVLVQANKPFVQHPSQNHARKNHSFLWMFEVPSRAIKKHLVLKGI